MNEKGMEMERQTCPRWRPTDDQIRIMTNIYNYEVSHPSRAQIFEIAAQLRAFGEAGEYNVQCWFNNHGNRVRRWQAELDPTDTIFSLLPRYMYETDWVVMRAPKLLDLFPIPIIIDDERDERQIPPPMPPAFRTRAPSMELTLRSPSNPSWVIPQAPRLLDLFPIPAIHKEEEKVTQPMPFRIKAPSTELSLRLSFADQ